MSRVLRVSVQTHKTVQWNYNHDNEKTAHSRSFTEPDTGPGVGGWGGTCVSAPPRTDCASQPSSQASRSSPQKWGQYWYPPRWLGLNVTKCRNPLEQDLTELSRVSSVGFGTQPWVERTRGGTAGLARRWPGSRLALSSRSWTGVRLTWEGEGGGSSSERSCDRFHCGKVISNSANIPEHLYRGLL